MVEWTHFDSAGKTLNAFIARHLDITFNHSLALCLSLLLFSFCPFSNPPSVIILYSSSHCIAQLDLPHHRPKPLYVPVTRNNESTFCTRDQYLAPRVAFITWLVTFFLEKKYVSSAAAAQSAKNGTEVIPKLIQVSMTFCWFLIVSLRMEEVRCCGGIFAAKPLSTSICIKTPGHKILFLRKYSHARIISCEVTVSVSVLCSHANSFKIL